MSSSPQVLEPDQINALYRESFYRAAISLRLIHDLIHNQLPKRAVNDIEADPLGSTLYFRVGVESNSVELTPMIKLAGRGENIQPFFEARPNKFAKLAYLYIQDHLIVELGGVESIKRICSSPIEQLTLIGPFASQKTVLTQRKLRRLSGVQISPLLALCKRFEQTTPKWIEEELEQLECEQLASIESTDINTSNFSSARSSNDNVENSEDTLGKNKNSCTQQKPSTSSK